jgi:prepilin-type N-terminal cleavage/methylation domain-containing protein
MERALQARGSTMSITSRSPRRDEGFSLLEILTVLAVIGITMAMAVMTTRTSLNAAKGDGAMHVLMATMRATRERAIADRRNIEIHFTGTNTIDIYRREVNGTTETGVTTLLETVVLENGVTFTAPNSVGISADTPDAFGNGSALAFNGALNYMFTSEGTFVDQSGEPLNATVFLGRASDPLSERAVTIFGPTALVHGYRWVGNGWQN